MRAPTAAAWMLAVFLFVLAVVVFGDARGQNADHAENHDWYKELRSNQGYSCCNGQTADGEGDCRPASVWRESDGTVRARIAGQTVIVPPSAVLPDRLNQRPLSGHACEKNGTWHCALVGGAGG